MFCRAGQHHPRGPRAILHIADHNRGGGLRHSWGVLAVMNTWTG